jgi:hypothetical protein
MTGPDCHIVDVRPEDNQESEDEGESGLTL